MGPTLFCQSCAMPIDNMAERGTEKDGLKSSEYCRYCYQHGAFTSPGISYADMKKIVTEKMQELNLPEDIIQKTLERLPFLKRWQ